MNNESDVIHVDPHITQYTVYIFDAYNRSMICSVNTTETSFAATHNILRFLCTKSQLGMQVERVNSVSQCRTAHLKVNKLRTS